MSSDEEMKIDPTRAAALVAQIKGVGERVSAAANGRNVRLVAVSKLKPANDILALHRSSSSSEGESPPGYSQLHFGENYAQELSAKAALLPRTVRWHMIGGLQSGHCKTLARIPNLWCVSSVDTPKKAELLNRYRGDVVSSSSSSASAEGHNGDEPKQQQDQEKEVGGEDEDKRLNIHIQVNTSGESSKSGCSPGQDTLALCRLVEEQCPNLRLLGLMTIGAIARSAAATAEGDANEDFECLKAQRDMVVRELFGGGGGGSGGRKLELSMGMSEDFENAIAAGSDEVRVGSTIFGTRPLKGEAKVKE